MSKTFNLLLVLALLFSTPAYAAEPSAVDEIGAVSPQQVATQAIQTGEFSKNYELTGENLVALIEKMVDFSDPQTAIVFNRWTGQLFVKHGPLAQDQVGQILSDIRTSVNRQVEIEARILTVKGTDFSQIGLETLGIDAFTQNEDKNDSFGTDSTFGDGSRSTGITFQDLTDGDGAGTGGQLSLATFSSRFNIAAAIDFLQKEAELNTLSAPRITVFNNQRAHIKIMQADFFIRELTVTSDTAAATVATEMDVTSAESGTILDVTPTINREGTITLELHPQFVTVDLTNTQTINVAGGAVIAAASQPFVRLPVFTNQSIDTTSTIEDGGVIVLGGLVDEQEERMVQQIPGLWRIPLLGRLFQNKSYNKVKTHLLIFIRAKTVSTSTPGGAL